MKYLGRVIFPLLALMVIVTGCGRSIDQDLIGAWKLIDDGEFISYLEFSDEKLIVRKDFEDAPETADYILTDLQKGKFIIEVAEPGTNTYIFFLEGFFEMKDKIKITKAMDTGDENFDLIKVKDLDKDIQKEKKIQEEVAAEEERAEKELAEKEKAEEKEIENDEKKANKNDASKTKDKQPKEKKAPEIVTQDKSLKAQYLREADLLNERIINESIQENPGDQDLQNGFYGQYYTEWDDLLNEIWGVLKNAMPTNEFEQLKADQNKWIKHKEKGFNEFSKEAASTRSMGMDYLALQTNERVYYLIENYLK